MLGPLECVVIGFAGARFDGTIAREIERVVESGTIRLVDIVLVNKDAAGSVTVVEIDNRADPAFASFGSLLRDRMALLTPEDLQHVATQLPPDTAGLALLFEHRWAEHIKEAMAASGGFLVGRTVIAPEVLEAASQELEAHMAAVAAVSA